VVETAKAINIPNDQRLLLVEPQEFVIDGHEVKEPIGMSGSRLEVKVHIVTGAQSAAENILKCVRRCGLEVERLVLNPSASAAAVLTEDEKQTWAWPWSTSAPAPPTCRSTPTAACATPP
jgi:cell division protein FtsA